MCHDMYYVYLNNPKTVKHLDNRLLTDYETALYLLNMIKHSVKFSENLYDS